MSAWTLELVRLACEGRLGMREAAALLDLDPIERARFAKRSVKDGWISQELFDWLCAALRADVADSDKPRTECLCCEVEGARPWRVVDQRMRLHVPGCWKILGPAVRQDPPAGWAWCEDVDCVRFVRRGASCYAGTDHRIHTDGGCGMPRMTT